MKIGVSGNIGSFSEEAAQNFCQKNKINDYEISYLVSVKNVLQDLDDKKIDIGIFPIENSNGGVVFEAVYAMSEHIFSVDEFFEIDVKHFLLAKKGITSEQINNIISHPQALKQCRMYLKRKWKSVELEEYSDTAQAAKDLNERKLSDDVAVIAPKRCAELYDLDIIEGNIQDLKFNFTTFIVAKK